MESEIAEKLDELDTLLAISQEDRRTVEAARFIVDEIVSEVIYINDGIKLCEDFCRENENPLPAANQHYPGASNELTITEEILFQQELDDFMCASRSLSNNLRDKVDQLDSFINELEEKREWIEMANTSEELDDISLGTLVSIDLKLVLEADDMKSEWKGMDLRKDVDKLLDELCRQIDEDENIFTALACDLYFPYDYTYQMENKQLEKLAELDILLAKSKEDRTRFSGFDKIEPDSIDLIDQLQVYIVQCDAYEMSGNQSPSVSLQLDAGKARELDGVLQTFMQEKWDILDKLVKKEKQFDCLIRRLEKKRKWIQNARTLEELEKISVGAPVSVNSKLLSDADSVRREWEEIEAKCEFLEKEDKNEVDKLLDSLHLHVDDCTGQLTKPCKEVDKGGYSCTCL